MDINMGVAKFLIKALSFLKNNEPFMFDLIF